MTLMLKLGKSLCLALLLTAHFAIAQDMISAEDMQKKYEQAQEQMQQSMPQPAKEEVMEEPEEGDVSDVQFISPSAKAYNAMASTNYETPIADVRIAVDFSSITIKDLVQEIVKQAEAKTGPWQVKWRIKRTNDHVILEKVDLTAESTFNDFMDHLIERVNNMTGVRLFVKVFAESRVIIISDTY